MSSAGNMLQIPAAFLTPEAKLTEAERIIGYTFSDKANGLQALQMRGSQRPNGIINVRYGNTTYEVPKNDRMAIVGDAVNRCAMSHEWLHTAREPRDWATIDQSIASNEALLIRGKRLGLDKCIIKDQQNTRVSKKMMATTVEALMGAVMNDGGYDAAVTAMRQIGLFDHPLLVNHMPTDVAATRSVL